ncbi:MAG TPA: flagellar biosynthesis regulator FlaF [Caulobacteraceae bacterium]
MGLRAYQQAAARSETPREAELRLFGQVTRALVEAAAVSDDDFKTRIEALDWNRRLWSALATDCSVADNNLPASLRAQIISLSLWVNRHSSLVMRKQETFDALIDINRMMMQGLSSRPESAAA